MSRRIQIMLVTSILVFGGIFAFLGISNYLMNQSMKGSIPPPLTISAMPVTSQSWQAKLQATGTLSAVNGVDVTTEIAGIVISILFSSGAEVKKGDLLVELNSATEKDQLRALEAQADLALITYNRDKKQLEVKAVSKAIVDADEADLKNKRALVSQQATVIAKKNIRAPFNGRLGLRIIDLGQFLNPGDKIVTLQSTDPIRLRYSLPQQVIRQISTNQEVRLTIDSDPGEVFKGKITAISSKIDPATRNVEMEATLPNPKGKLIPGMFGMVEILTGHPHNILTLPQDAIAYNPYGDLVYVVKEKGRDEKDNPIYEANQKFVTLGETRGDQVQVLTGLEQNDMVVTSGQMKLKNGSLVVLNNKVAPEGASNPALRNQ